jgi:hypothetical protein
MFFFFFYQPPFFSFLFIFVLFAEIFSVWTSRDISSEGIRLVDMYSKEVMRNVLLKAISFATNKTFDKKEDLFLFVEVDRTTVAVVASHTSLLPRR